MYEGENMATILLVEDNTHIMKINATALRMRGYQILCAETIKQGKEMLEFHDVDLVVLDVMLPDGSGLDFCGEIQENYHIPILFLSALGDNRDIIAGLRAGGDDYLAKPYDLDVFIARIEARIRSIPTTVQSQIVKVGELELNQTSLRAILEGVDLLLTPKEFAVLFMLAQNINYVVKKEDIYQCVWGTTTGMDSKVLWTVISRLKKKLRSQESGIHITSKRSEGYLLEQW